MENTNETPKATFKDVLKKMIKTQVFKYGMAVVGGYLLCICTNVAIANTHFTQECMKGNSLVWTDLEILQIDLNKMVDDIQIELEKTNDEGRDLGFYLEK